MWTKRSFFYFSSFFSLHPKCNIKSKHSLKLDMHAYHPLPFMPQFETKKSLSGLMMKLQAFWPNLENIIMHNFTSYSKISHLKYLRCSSTFGGG